jgi:nucleoside-diphosphate-sugar epimerase
LNLYGCQKNRLGKYGRIIKMKILLTGATGFLGSHLLPELIRKDYKVIIVKRSFSDPWRIRDCLPLVKSFDIDKINIEEIFHKNKIDVIMHLATDYGKKNSNDITQMLQCNIELPTKLLQMGAKYKNTVFINTHTSADSKYTLYSAMKNAFLEIMNYFVANHEMRFINLKLEYMYGEKDDNTKFIPFVLESIFNKTEIKASGGQQKRDFIYVKDVVDAYLKVLDNLGKLRKKYLLCEIGTGKSIPLKNFVIKAEKISGHKANIKWGTISYRKNETFDSKANINLAKKLLNWHPKVSLGKGLENTINWYKKH